MRILLVGLLLLGIGLNLYMALSMRLLHKTLPSIGGISYATVRSGSMEPTISVGDLLIYLKKEKCETGDIVVYEDAGSLVTHRIISVTDAGYTTQGDANQAPDVNIVERDRVYGSVIGRIPYVGQMVGFLQTPFGLLLVLMVFLLWRISMLCLQKHQDLNRGKRELDTTIRGGKHLAK